VATVVEVAIVEMLQVMRRRKRTTMKMTVCAIIGGLNESSKLAGEITTASPDGGKGKGKGSAKDLVDRKKGKDARKTKKAFKSSRAKNFDRPPGRKPLDMEKRNKMKVHVTATKLSATVQNSCSRKKGGCGGQSAKGKRRKAAVQDQLSSVLKKRQAKRKGRELSNVEIEAIEETTAVRLEKTHNAKKALYVAFNLTDSEVRASVLPYICTRGVDCSRRRRRLAGRHDSQRGTGGRHRRQARGGRCDRSAKVFIFKFIFFT